MDYDNKESYTLAILVNNKSGVLMRVVSLFSRRGYNIDSLSVGETENKEVSRITIVVSGDRSIVEQIIRQAEKLIDVKSVYEMTPSKSVQRELVLIKIKATNETRSDIVSLGDIFKAKIVDVTPNTVTFQLTGSLDKLQSFMDLANSYGIIELVRTGITGLTRGEKPLSELSLDE